MRVSDNVAQNTGSGIIGQEGRLGLFNWAAARKEIFTAGSESEKEEITY